MPGGMVFWLFFLQDLFLIEFLLVRHMKGLLEKEIIGSMQTIIYHACHAEQQKKHSHQANSHKKHHPNAGLVQHHDNGHNISLCNFFWSMIFFTETKIRATEKKAKTFFPFNWLFNRDPYNGVYYKPFITGQ